MTTSLLDRRICFPPKGQPKIILTASSFYGGDAIFDQDAEADESITNQYDSYLTALVKLVPSEIISAYLAANGILESIIDKKKEFWWIVPSLFFAFTAFVCFFYTKKISKVSQFSRRIYIVSAFIAWAYIIGGPFEATPGYNPAYGVAFSVFVPLVSVLLVKNDI